MLRKRLIWYWFSLLLLALLLLLKVECFVNQARKLPTTTSFSKKKRILRDVPTATSSNQNTLIDPSNNNSSIFQDLVSPLHYQSKHGNFQTSLLNFSWWQPQKWNIPNKLTMARVISIPAFVSAFMLKKVIHPLSFH